MDIILIIIAALCMILGLLGSFLPILPGPFSSWVGLLLLYLTKAIPMYITLIVITFIIAVAISVLDYIIPSMGTKRFGGTKAGIIGTSIGLVVGLFAPIPGGIIIGPFIGAFIGELINKSNSKTALKAAFGSLIGFLASTIIKFIIAVIYLGLFISVLWDYRQVIFAS
ncbi:DUF456 domain-containing protein [Confluentibacter sediminis]|uniref:DUF456 domain-containing protein n=1 Tax=Confluentibacter sediminis TaxID=2219045 RepID=UPI000DAC9C02|nr:DUF456 domain-containing protein [Confluentibacter sediminis]